MKVNARGAWRRLIHTRLLNPIVCAAITAAAAIAGLERVVAQQAAPATLEFAGAVNLVKQNAKLQGVLLLDPGIVKIRCLLYVVHFGQMSEQFYRHRAVRQMAAEAQCGLVLASITTIQFKAADSPAAELNRNAGVAGDVGVFSLAEGFARDSGHPELKTAPIAFWGFSAAASFGTTFAALHPERTIAFVRYHTHRRGVSPSVEVLKGIPALFVAGGKDETAGTEDANEFWASGRRQSAPWTFVVEPQAAHSAPDTHEITLRTLTVPWLESVLRLRLAEGPALRPLREDGWLGNVKTFDIASPPTFVGDSRSASWLPDPNVARAWQAIAKGGQ